MKHGTKYTLPAYKGKKYTVADSLVWIKYADADSIVEELCDRLEDAFKNYGAYPMRDILQGFLDRAKKRGKSSRIGGLNYNVRLAYKTFTDPKHPEPHACVNFNIRVRKEFGKRIDGKTYYWTGEIGRAMWRYRFDRKS